MNKVVFIGIFALICISCNNTSNQNEIEKLHHSLDSIQTVAYSQSEEIIKLRDSISILKYPASDRYAQAQKYFSEGNYDRAQNEINDLNKIFPNSPEATMSDALRQKINNELEKQRKEQERIAALGFKAIQQYSKVTVGYNTITLSQFSTGKEFTFDAYDDRWFYRTADRGDKYVTMAMSVTSTSKEPMIPEFAIYSINGSQMTMIETFTTRYARWMDYGAYLGNYTDNNNNFAKVSTVKFKLGAEVSESVINSAYAIVMYNANVLTEQYDRFANPPQYWTGSASFAKTLTVDSFNSSYVLIKTFNLK